jgi:hypothetical protein
VIIEFIALDSVNRALEFYDELILKLQNIIHISIEKEIIHKMNILENLFLKVILSHLK